MCAQGEDRSLQKAESRRERMQSVNQRTEKAEGQTQGL